MKTLVSLLFSVLGIVSTYAQTYETKVYANGLIYRAWAMRHLTHKVNHLHSKLDTCTFKNIIYSKEQVIGHYIELETENIDLVKKDLEQNISYRKFISKYPNAKSHKKLLIIKKRFKDLNNKDIITFVNFDLRDNHHFNVQSKDTSLDNKSLKDKWVFEEHSKRRFSNSQITAFYFTENFEPIELPEKYSSMVNYCDYLIDTTTPKLSDNQTDGWVDLPPQWIYSNVVQKKILLEQLRSTHVVPICIHDNKPREYAMNIALLSSETSDWNIFIKAHLDLLNNRSAVLIKETDSLVERNTYIKELEELKLNVPYLLMGTCLTIENPATNHYVSNIKSIGKAIYQSKYRTEIEGMILTSISDDELDDYNKIMLYFLFESYNYHVKDKRIKKANEAKLTRAIKTIPRYLRKKR